jgi:hypothetical protein
MDLNLDLVGSCLCGRREGHIVWKEVFCKKEVLDWGGGENVKIKQFFSSLEVVFGLFILNSRSYYKNGFA